MTRGSAREVNDWREKSDQEIVAGVSRNDARAVREYYERFAPRLARLARRLGCPDDDAEEIVDDVIEASLILLVSRSRAQIRCLPAYLERSVRNRVQNWRRLRLREQTYVSEDVLDPDRTHGTDGTVCSEGSRRASQGEEFRDSSLSLPLRRLVSALDEGVTDEEKLILQWISNLVPHGEIARWLGAGYEATSRRIRRLADRLLDAAEKYAAGLSENEWRELEPFFRRAAEGDEQTRLVRWNDRVKAARRRRYSIEQELGP
jgi:DNA-directed RNA polymerase specialized sigma24 family protein